MTACVGLTTFQTVSYTHLDVYKRQTYAQPLLLTKITDQGILGKNLTALLSSVLFFVAAKVSVAGMGVLRSYEFVKIHNQMFGRLNEKAFAKLYSIPISMYKEKNGMQILQALQTDIQLSLIHISLRTIPRSVSV